jgi:hypothetical protein
VAHSLTSRRARSWLMPKSPGSPHVVLTLPYLQVIEMPIDREIWQIALETTRSRDAAPPMVSTPVSKSIN